MNNENNISDCPISRALRVIGGKWRLYIISQIGDNTYRFGQLKKIIPNISEKMLIQELKNLVAAGIVNREAYKEIPPRVEYSLTDLGKKVFPILDTITLFGEELEKANTKR